MECAYSKRPVAVYCNTRVNGREVDLIGSSGGVDARGEKGELPVGSGQFAVLREVIR